MLAIFHIRNCTGGFVERIDLDIPESFAFCSNYELVAEFGDEVFENSCVTNHVCSGCTDSAYTAHFVEFNPPIGYGRPCDSCGGSGNAESELYDGIVKCPDCRGKGRVV